MKTYEIKKVDYKNCIAIRPLKRCSEKGVEDFIAKEASSYSSENVGTIHTSIGKKAVDDDLRSEQKELSDLVSEVGEPTPAEVVEYKSSVSKETIHTLLATQVNNWSFQTSNSHELVTFYGKGTKPSIELFINFKESGDRSYLCMGHHFGYLSEDSLEYLKEKLLKVYKKVTTKVTGLGVVSETTSDNGVILQCESIKIEDPEKWFSLKEEALAGFMGEEEAPSFVEKLLGFFDFKVRDSISIYQLLSGANGVTLGEDDVAEYFLKNIKIDIKQIYA